MEVVKFHSSDLGILQRKMASFAETLLAAQISLASVIMMDEFDDKLTRNALKFMETYGSSSIISWFLTGFLLQYVHAFHNLIGTDQSFPISELHKKGTTEPEAKDGSDDEDDDDDDDDEAGEPEDDAGDEDFSGDEKEEDDDDDDDDDGEANDPAANGNQGSDDEDDDDEEDDDEDGEEEEEEEDEEEDDEEEEPPAKKRK
ncbi:hypothetical protein R6Q59_013255 [Mikania micrantha]